MIGYLSVTQYSKKTGKDVGNIRKLIHEGRIPAIKIGNQWVIREDTPYPPDKRVRSGRYKNWRKPKQEESGE